MAHGCLARCPVGSAHDLDGTVVVAVAVVRVMKVAVDQVVDVIAVWHGRVTAVIAMDMGRVMATAVVVGSAGSGVAVVHAEHVFVDVIAMHVMEMAVVEIIDMTIVFDREVAAVAPMFVIMLLVGVAILHVTPSAH